MLFYQTLSRILYSRKRLKSSGWRSHGGVQDQYLGRNSHVLVADRDNVSNSSGWFNLQMAPSWCLHSAFISALLDVVWIQCCSSQIWETKTIPGYSRSPTCFVWFPIHIYIYNYTYIYISICMYHIIICVILNGHPISTSMHLISELIQSWKISYYIYHIYIYGIILPNWRTPWFFRGVVIPPNSVTGGFLLWSGIMRIMHWKSYYISNSRHLFFHRPPQPRQGVAWRRPGLLGLDASVTGWRWPWPPQEMSRKWWIHGDLMVNSWWFNGEFMVI